MSLRIDPEKVVSVLLTSGQSFRCDPGSFSMDAYEFVEDTGFVLHGGGNSGICATGFQVQTQDGDIFCGPLSAITAVEVMGS